MLDTSERAALDWFRAMHPGQPCKVIELRESGCVSVLIVDPAKALPAGRWRRWEPAILATMEETVEAWSEALDAYRATVRP